MTTKAKTSLAALALLATLGLGASGAAQAHGSDVYWSIGMSSPGVTVGVSNAPVVVQPPVIYAPAPVVVAPRPVIYPQPMPVYYGYPVFRRHHGWDHERGWERREWEHGDYYRGQGRGGYDRDDGRGYGGGEYRAAPPLGRR
jgi:hypothetical protein